MKIVLISILFILFVSCNDSSERTTDVRMICFKDTNKEELKKENIKYEFVQLETTDESLLDGIFQIRITEDRLFIINQKFDKVLVFGPKEPVKVAERIKMRLGCFGAAVADVNDLKRAAVLGVSELLV